LLVSSVPELVEECLFSFRDLVIVGIVGRAYAFGGALPYVTSLAFIPTPLLRSRYANGYARARGFCCFS
jgi:hypothetical protein